MENAVIANFQEKKRWFSRRPLRLSMLFLPALLVATFIHFALQNHGTTYDSLRPIVSANAPQSQPAKGAPAAVPSSSTSQSKASGGASSRSATVPTIPAAPKCSPVTSTAPSQVSLDVGQVGLKKVIDNPQYYQVYGYTAADVRKQLSDCGPLSDGDGKFAGSTSYAINWAVSYSVATDDKCTVASAAVGLHVSQVLPQWNNSAYATTGYASRWQAFVDNLQTHENGHRDLYIDYATQLQRVLQNLSQSNCADFMNHANSQADAILVQLRQADEAYDQRTNHGALQGAIVPAL